MTAASNNARPKSRQSTASIASNSTQPLHPNTNSHSFNAPHPHMPQAPWPQHGVSMPPQAPQHQYFQGGKSFTMPLNMPSQGMPPFNSDSTFAQVTIHPQKSVSFPSADVQRTPLMDIGMEDLSNYQGDSGVDASKSKKGASTTQANDNELRRLLRENQGRSLADIAKQINKDDTGSKQEKDKQVFGMLWLQQHVRRLENHSVPRNEVYNEYQFSCGDLRVQTLNPASFGKLVRIIFSNIVTRRLGVRGNSKYHYVGLALVSHESKKDLSTRLRAPSIVNEGSSRDVEPKRVASRSQHLPADSAMFSHAGTPAPAPQQLPIGRPSAESICYQKMMAFPSSGSQPPENIMLPRPLRFPRALDRLDQKDVQFELPDISPYLPPGTDTDAANSLCSVYRSHCVLAIDNFRYCKTEKLCESFKSLHGLLTVPGQKLLAAPNIVPWIRECDWRKYQSMIPMLNMILLNQVPLKAMSHMQNVAINLCSWIRHFFQNLPVHVQTAMQGPANVFVSLLGRFCRVQAAARELAPILDSVDKRNQMWRDWVTLTDPLQIVESSLRYRGHRRCRLIVTREIRLLLNPSQSPQLTGTWFEDFGEELTDFRRAEMTRECKTSSDLLARLYRFLLSLQSRFPHAPAYEILNAMERMSGAAGRNMTLAGASTIAEWWRTKVFMDEAIAWISEMGGLFENSSDILTPTPQFSGDLAVPFYDFEMDQVSRPGTGSNQHSGTGFNTPAPSITHAHPEVSRPPSLAPQRTDSNEPVKEEQQATHIPSVDGVHEDSGIGLGIHDDFGADPKYITFVGGVAGSDPADVVVC